MMANLDTARESRAAAAIACVLAGALTCCGARTAVDISPRDASTEVRLDAGPSDAGPRPSACDPPTATCTWRAGETVPLGDDPASNILAAASCDRGEFAFAYTRSTTSLWTHARVIGGNPLRTIADVALPRVTLAILPTRDGWVDVGVPPAPGVCQIEWRRADFALDHVESIAGTSLCDADITGDDELSVFSQYARIDDRSTVHVFSISRQRIERVVTLPEAAQFVVVARPLPDGGVLAIFLTPNGFPLVSHVDAVVVGADGSVVAETRVREFSIVTAEPDRDGPGFIAIVTDASLAESRLLRVVSERDAIRTEDLGTLTRPGLFLGNPGELAILPHHYLANDQDGRVLSVAAIDSSIRAIPGPITGSSPLSSISSSDGSAYVAHFWTVGIRPFLRMLTCEP